jgi:hypothetical protein
MRINYGICATVFAAALFAAPLVAKAELSKKQSDAIVAAVDSAMKTGDTSKLQAVLAEAVLANPTDAGAVAALAAQEITKDDAANPGATIEGSTTTIAEAVTTSAVIAIVSTAPSESGNVLGELQANLSPDLTVAAVTATQAALAPAAGGGNNLASEIRQLVADFKALLTTIIQTAELAQRSSASPHS